MWFLFSTTVAASFLDSLNPSAIAQQMLLQASVKNKRHVWFFILGIALANLAMGLAIYYGVAAWVSRAAARLTQAAPALVYGAGVCLGAACLAAGARLVVKTRKSRACADTARDAQPARMPASLAPSALFAMGAAFCMVELTSAMPYFGFLALLTRYSPGFPLTLLMMLVYNFMYILPLILVYLGYNRLQGTRAIRRLEGALGSVSAYVVPCAVTLAGLWLLYSGASSLVRTFGLTGLPFAAIIG